MKFSTKLPSPSLVLSVIAVVLAMSGITWAAANLPRNSVGTKQVKKGGIRSSDIRNRNVKSPDLGTNSVSGPKVRADSLGGDDILESSLGQVPSAATAGRAASAASADKAALADNATRANTAGNADQLGGRAASGFVRTDEIVNFVVELSYGESSEFLTNGTIGLKAECRENVGAQGQDELRLLAFTTAPDAFMQGDTPHGGPGVGSNFMQPDDPETNRTIGGIVTTQAGEGLPAAEDDIDTGFVYGSEGEYIGVDESIAYVMNHAGSDCRLLGTARIIG